VARRVQTRVTTRAIADDTPMSTLTLGDGLGPEMNEVT
jgi:hypothetical protein